MKSMSFSTSLEEQAPLVERVLAVNVSGLQESSGHLRWTPDFKAKPQLYSWGQVPMFQYGTFRLLCVFKGLIPSDRIPCLLPVSNRSASW